VGCTFHADPFHRSAIVAAPPAPTAVQSSEAAQLTPASVAPAMSAVGCIVQVLPFHESAIAVCACAGPVNQPTAMQDAGPVQETASR